ncbi:MAG TPA: carbohydrate ABC transporter permease [Candidatus Dormibacteraeota bacterium]|nr:carbohydrate ABC transporter permease [Candidatus Dormibacteraeota bacterium]
MTATLQRTIARTPLHVFFIVIGVIWVLPTLGLLATSLRPVDLFTRSGWWTVLQHPTQLTLSNFQNLFQDPLMGRGLVNSVLIAVPATVIPIVVATLAAYASTFLEFRGRYALLLIVVGLMVVPVQMALIPMSRLYGLVGLRGIPAIVLFHTAFAIPYATFLFRNFFLGIPGELLESARVDGAGDFRIFATIILPLGLPAVASFAVFQFLWVWNDLLVALVYSDAGSKPVTVAIFENLRSFGTSVDVISAGSFVSLLVPLLLFFLFQRHFVQGLLAGSVKG